MKRWLVSFSLFLFGVSTVFAQVSGGQVYPNSGSAPSGPAGGALSGTFPNPTASQPIAPNQNAIYASTTCGTQTNCFPVTFDVRFVRDATSTSTTTVTAPDLGATAADVGKIVFMTSDGSNGSLICAQTTVASINSGTSIVLNSACGSSVSGTGWLFLGHDDTTALSTAWTATGCNQLVLPTGYAFVQSAEFISSPACDVSAAAPYAGPSVIEPIDYDLIPTPNFNFSSCTGGIASNACFGGTLAGMWQLSIWGGGYNGGGTTHNVTLFELGNAARAQNAGVQGWCANCPGSIGIKHNSVNGWFAEGGAVNAGYIACDSTAIQAIWIGNFCESQKSYSMEAELNGFAISIGNSFETAATSWGNVNVIGRMTMMNDNCLSVGSGTSGIVAQSTAKLLMIGNTCDVSAATNATALNIVGGANVALQGNTLKGNSGASDIFFQGTLPTFNDLGGNIYAGSTHIIGTGTVLDEVGSANVPAATANLVLSAGWGSTATKTAFNGGNAPISFTITNSGTGQASSPTIAYTFPTPFLISPFSCSALQTGGTNATGTFTASSLSATGVTFTYSLTPTVNDTEIVQVTCVTP